MLAYKQQLVTWNIFDDQHDVQYGMVKSFIQLGYKILRESH
jgi:hypothetical protein